MVESLARRTVTLLKMLLVVVVFIALTYYLVIAFTSQDALWFGSGFDATPYRIIVYDAGKATEYRQGDAGFDELAQGLRSSLDAGIARASGVGLGEESLTAAYGQYLTVEAFFAQPVRFHAPFYTGHPTQMLIPITGRHSELSVVFLGTSSGYQVNAPAFKTLQPLKDALAGLGYTIR